MPTREFEPAVSRPRIDPFRCCFLARASFTRAAALLLELGAWSLEARPSKASKGAHGCAFGRSQSISSTSLPRGSIPSMPSLPSELRSLTSKRTSPVNASTPTQQCRILHYCGPGEGATTAAIWALDKCDCRFFYLQFWRFEWFVQFPCWQHIISFGNSTGS